MLSNFLSSYLPFEGFYLGPVYVYTWGLFTALGILIAIEMVNRKLKNENKLNFPFFIISIFIGARILYIIETWNYYYSDPLAMLQLWEGGFSFFGGVLGGILAGWIWNQIHKINFWRLSYCFTPAWLFGLFFGRLGCFLIQDHLGKPTDLPWGIFIQGAYRHEPALYEALWALLIAIGLYWVDRKALANNTRANNTKSQSPISNKALNPNVQSNQRKKLGLGDWDFIGNWAFGFGYFKHILFPLSLFLYSLGRFFLDFLRAGDERFYSLTLAQWLCVAIFIWSGTTIVKNIQIPSSDDK